MGTPIGRSTLCQSQVLHLFLQKRGECRTNPEGGGTDVRCRGETKSRAAGGGLVFISGGSLGWVFLACSLWSHIGG